MRTLMIIAALAAAPAPAATQAAPLTLDTPIETIVADPAGKAVIDREMPDLQKHEAYEMIKGMSLKQLQPISGGAVTDEMLVKVGAGLTAVGKTPAK